VRKYLNRLRLGSIISVSAFAFAVEAVSAPLVLSDVQMDVVTAGSGETINQSNTGNNLVLGLNPAVAILSDGDVTAGNNYGQSNSEPNQSNTGNNLVLGPNPAIAILSDGNVTVGNNYGQSNSAPN
jgi:hypothetical protein